MVLQTVCNTRIGNKIEEDEEVYPYFMYAPDDDGRIFGVYGY